MEYRDLSLDGTAICSIMALCSPAVSLLFPKKARNSFLPSSLFMEKPPLRLSPSILQLILRDRQ